MKRLNETALAPWPRSWPWSWPFIAAPSFNIILQNSIQFQSTIPSYKNIDTTKHPEFEKTLILTPFEFLVRLVS